MTAVLVVLALVAIPCVGVVILAVYAVSREGDEHDGPPGLEGYLAPERSWEEITRPPDPIPVTYERLTAMQQQTVSALTDCPYCGRKAGEACRTVSGGDAAYVHVRRWRRHVEENPEAVQPARKKEKP